MDTMSIDDIPVETPKNVIFTPFGKPIEASEVSDRLSHNLYTQLSEESDETTIKAINRSQIYVGSILRRLRVSFDLDNQCVREIVLIYTIYELHIALGHEEAGREYRMKAKDIILAAYGRFPDSDDAQVEKEASAAVRTPPRTSRYRKALFVGDRYGHK